MTDHIMRGLPYAICLFAGMGFATLADRLALSPGACGPAPAPADLRQSSAAAAEAVSRFDILADRAIAYTSCANAMPRSVSSVQAGLQWVEGCARKRAPAAELFQATFTEAQRAEQDAREWMAQKRRELDQDRRDQQDQDDRRFRQFQEDTRPDRR